MRLFTGIALAPHVIDRLSSVLAELRPTAAIKWSPIGNLHITSKFIGEWPEDRLAELQRALTGAGGTGKINIIVSKFGFLPNPHRPTAFIAGVQAGPELENLAATIGRLLEPLGCAAESRPYRPHVTLARIKATGGKPNSDVQRLREHIAGMTDFDFGNFEASQFHLYRSTPGQRNSEYSILASYDLMRERVV